MPQGIVAAGPAETIQEEAPEARLRIARHLAELHRLHLALAHSARDLKRFSLGGHARIEAEIAAEMLEGYLGAIGAFLENMRGRFEARLPTIRRGDPRGPGPSSEEAPGYGNFWLVFSRLRAVLRHVERRVAG
ncbi:hypothetical protein SAMN02745194_00535 [Roseomonas rosea]|uniref:Uncharacterized protein n=1 Tax=Muricoccus roseus TaxID=198092 RepID=A0A1M6BZJ5_9PROT|nr:hypothetical protein [Roseomonas rosea]SHI54205.1 hypothetical protein SAMN02745194_00535 [Roseomonas rosea]